MVNVCMVHAFLFGSGVTETTFRFDDSLEGLKELRKADIFTSMFYYRERVQIKIEERKKCIQWNRGENKYKGLVVLSVELL